MGLLPFLALITGALIVLTRVVAVQEYEVVFPIVAVWVPVFTVVTAVVWLLLVVGLVRLVSGIIVRVLPDGPVGGHVARRDAHQRALISTYPIYASCITPWGCHAAAAPRWGATWRSPPRRPSRTSPR
ncbi:hypothetical protein QJS66_01875 [Kocuria rhizophila]|nr:hypothetical protein QJS66_01875 [Kocuria rhizophila]